MKFAQGLGLLFLLSLSGLSDQVYAECIESKEIPLEDPSAARKLAFSGFEPEVKRYVVRFLCTKKPKTYSLNLFPFIVASLLLFLFSTECSTLELETKLF